MHRLHVHNSLRWAIISADDYGILSSFMILSTDQLPLVVNTLLIWSYLQSNSPGWCILSSYISSDSLAGLVVIKSHVCYQLGGTG